MKVLRCYIAMPPCPGGMEQHIAELSRRQRQLGIDVINIYNVGDLQNERGIQILSGWPILHLWPHALRDAIFYAAVCWRIWRRGEQADVVHVHGDWSAYLCGAVLKKISRARILVASMHGHMQMGFGRRWLYRFSTIEVDVGYATGAREALILTKLSGRTWANVTSGISDFFFHSGVKERFRSDVVTVASLLPVKGIELVLEVARKLPHRNFMIIGDGPQRQQLEALASDLANCTFVGRLEGSEVARMLRASRLMLLTSLREGTPTAVLEAMASGLPVVTTSSNDYGPLLGDDGGAVLSCRNAVDIATVVEEFLTDKTRLEVTGRRNLRRSEGYSWDAVSRRVSNLMVDALQFSTSSKENQK